MLAKSILNPKQFSFLSKRTLVNINRRKMVKEKQNLDSEENLTKLFDQLKRENEELDHKYRYISETNKLGYIPEDPAVPIDEKAYDLDNDGELDEQIKKRIYDDENIPEDKNGVSLLYTSDAKMIYKAFRKFSWKNYTPLDSVKFTHTKVLQDEVYFEDGVQIKMNLLEFVEEKLLPFLGPEKYDAWKSKKCTDFRRGGLGSSVDKNSVHHDYDRLTLKEVKEIQELNANFREEFKDEIEYYDRNVDNNPNLKKPRLDVFALSNKYRVPAVAIRRVIQSKPLVELAPKVLERRTKSEQEKLKRREEEYEREARDFNI